MARTDSLPNLANWLCCPNRAHRAPASWTTAAIITIVDLMSHRFELRNPPLGFTQKLLEKPCRPTPLSRSPGFCLALRWRSTRSLG